MKVADVQKKKSHTLMQIERQKAQSAFSVIGYLYSNIIIYLPVKSQVCI